MEIPEGERLSWAAYFGAATGLVLGILAAVLGAEGLYLLAPHRAWAEIFWEVGSPILALLGLIVGGFGFHRYLRGRIILPGILFVLVLGLGMFLVLRPEAFAWRHPTQDSPQSEPEKPRT